MQFYRSLSLLSTIHFNQSVTVHDIRHVHTVIGTKNIIVVRMIPYSKSFNGIQLLFQVNGSSLYRAACIQGLISLILFLVIRILSLRTSQWTIDPMVMEVIIASVTLLIVFRVNHSYERYWAACGHVHHMMSLWMDAATNACVFYMQQSHHDHHQRLVGGAGGMSFKPPNYFETHDLNRWGLSRDRQRSTSWQQQSSNYRQTKDNKQPPEEEEEEEEEKQDHYCRLFPISSPASSSTAVVPDFLQDLDQHSCEETTSMPFTKKTRTTAGKLTKMPSIFHQEGEMEAVRLLRHYRQYKSTMGDARYLLQSGRMDGGWGLLAFSSVGRQEGNGTTISATATTTNKMSSTYGSIHHHLVDSASWTHSHDHEIPVVDPRGFASDAGGRTPSLYLQELVHLASLCNAVAFATLRNNNYQQQQQQDDDVDDARMMSSKCFSFYHPGEPWPEVDSSKIGLHDASATSSTRRRSRWQERIQTALESIILEECSTRPGIRKCQHASRPIPVLGGVSQNEILFLEKAKGPSAKVQLAWSWFSEFMTREDLAGSFGGIGSPIISNIHASLSEGMAHYNHCRKIMFMPFPFPHAQLTAAYIITIMVIIPILLDEYMKSTIVGAIVTFLSVTCLAGLHEVARELENPFENIPNEVPLTVLQAMFNDSLITLFAGFHPDHYWNADDFRSMYSKSQ